MAMGASADGVLGDGNLRAEAPRDAVEVSPPCCCMLHEARELCERFLIRYQASDSILICEDADKVLAEPGLERRGSEGMLHLGRDVCARHGDGGEIHCIEAVSAGDVEPAACGLEGERLRRVVQHLVCHEDRGERCVSAEVDLASRREPVKLI